MAERALAGVRVVDLSQGIAGPYATRLMADLGAEVIKVEPPGGDYTRRLGPFPGDVPDGEKSGLFIHLNGNKKSVVLDIASDDGKATLRKLLATADALVAQGIGPLGLTASELPDAARALLNGAGRNA